MEENLKMHTLIGFNGLIKDGLCALPNKSKIIFATGNTVVIQDIETRTQEFLKGHTNEIQCLSVSRCGTFVATSDKRAPGFISEIIVWDLSGMRQLHSFKMHKGSARKLAFSGDGTYLASSGGIDDKNRLIVWELKTGKAAYAFSLGSSEIRDLQFLNHKEDRLIAATDSNIQILSLNSKDKKIDSLTCKIGNLKRNFTAIAIERNDEFFYASTKSGDIIEVTIDQGIMKRIGPTGQLFENGVKCLYVYALPNSLESILLVGSGDGKVTRVPLTTMKRGGHCELEGGISSISILPDQKSLICGTEIGNIYSIDIAAQSDLTKLSSTLRETNHIGKVNAIAFPKDFSEVFATCGKEQIRVWALKRKQEVLRIIVPMAECFCLCFSDDGKAIVSGWSDGKIRAFYPQSGKLMWTIEDAHIRGVTALVMNSKMDQIISGGMEGEVRIWKVTKNTRTLEDSMKEHRGRVWSMKIRTDNEVVSCSSDGSCIIWDVKNHARVICIFDKTIFKNVAFFPDGSQLITVGSDGKITYWSSFEGEAIRAIEGSETEGEINALDISSRGNFLVTGGQDNTLRIWSYHRGECVEKKTGHCGGIQNAKISPNEQFVVSAGSDGDIVIWSLSEKIQEIK
jgi:WD40 repeat protein